MTEVDLKGKTAEELAQMMYDGVTEAVPEEAEPTEQPEETEAPDEVTEVDEGEPEEPEETEAAEATEEVAEETPEPDVTELDEIRARLAAAEARAKHSEQTTGRFTGELGFLRQENARLKAQVAQPAAAPQDDYGDEPARPAQPSPKVQMDSPALVSLTLKQATQDFVAAHPDVVENGDFSPEFKEAVANTRYDVQSLLTHPDAVEASSTMTALLQEAHGRFDVQKKAAAAELVVKKRADQAASLKSRKRAAAVSSSGKPAPGKPKAKQPEDMSVDELAKEIRAQEQNK